MKKNIDLIIDGIAPKKVMYDTDNHSLVVLYPARKEFKRGDIVYHNNMVSIFSTYTNSAYEFHGLYNVLIDGSPWHIGKFNNQGVRIATTSEQQILFDALKKENKKWDAETLKIKDLDISEIVYNLSSACNYLNKPVPDFKSLLLTISNEDFHKYKAQITLQLIREAWNKFDEFEANWNDNEQNNKYFPIIDDDKIASSCHNAVKTIELACYSFKSKERALQFGNQFKGLLKTAMGI